MKCEKSLSAIEGVLSNVGKLFQNVLYWIIFSNSRILHLGQYFSFIKQTGMYISELKISTGMDSTGVVWNIVPEWSWQRRLSAFKLNFVCHQGMEVEDDRCWLKSQRYRRETSVWEKSITVRLREGSQQKEFRTAS